MNMSTKTTISGFIEDTARQFEEAGLAFGHGTSSPYEDAAFLVFEILQFSGDEDQDLTEEQVEKLSAAVAERISTRKPSPYIAKRAYIHGIPFYVDERVIVPRSFIGELLCHEDGFAMIDDPGDIKTVADICTGSGCLAVIAAHVFPEAQVDATDLSPLALDVARRNVKELDLEDRVSLFEGDLFAPLKGRRYDLIIANPPYVDRQGMDSLPPEYRHEPALALDGGADGLDLVRRILKDAKTHLQPGGGLLCEIGRGRELLEREYPGLPFLWLDTEESEGEVFWIRADQL